MTEFSEQELGDLFSIADMNIGAYVALLSVLLAQDPELPRQAWFAKLAEVTANFDPEDMRILLAVAVARIREARQITMADDS